jgi:NADPH:quinone reductase-like Zn-dependent oxidoreductase
VRAVVSHAAGPPESLVVEDVPVPEPGAGEVQVKVRAAAVNFPDVLLVADGYQVPVPRPFVPGSELAGEVMAVGADVTSVRPGDLVVGTTMTGAFAEVVVLPASAVSRLPAGADLQAAAGFLVAYTTAYHALRTAAVTAGESVLVLGAAGGVGLACVDLAHQQGARVVAAASSPAKLAHCRGADVLVDYGSAPLRAALRAAEPGGVDVVLDPVGGELSEPALRHLRPGGRFVTLGYASGAIPSIPLNLVLLKQIAVLGFDLRAFSAAHPADAETARAQLLSLLAQGRLHPVVSRTFPLEQASAALRHVADRQAVGKVLVIPGSARLGRERLPTDGTKGPGERWPGARH